MVTMRFYRLVPKTPMSGRGRRHYALASGAHDLWQVDPDNYKDWAISQHYCASYCAERFRWETFGPVAKRADACLNYYWMDKPGYVISSTAEGVPLRDAGGNEFYMPPAKLVLVSPVVGTIVKYERHRYRYDGQAFVQIEDVDPMPR